jgi:hypothetical protein
MTFKDPGDYDRIMKGSRLSFPDLRKSVEGKKTEVTAVAGEKSFTLELKLTERERRCILEGGLLNLVKKEKGIRSS